MLVSPGVVLGFSAEVEVDLELGSWLALELVLYHSVPCFYFRCYTQ